MQWYITEQFVQISEEAPESCRYVSLALSQIRMIWQVGKVAMPPCLLVSLLSHCERELGQWSNTSCT